MSIRDRMSGNEAIATAMRQINPDVFAMFPITPSTEIPQYFAKYVADGKVDTEFILKSDLCGAPGIHVFMISSDKKGTFDLIADYKRPWEKVDPVKTEKLSITFR